MNKSLFFSLLLISTTYIVNASTQPFRITGRTSNSVTWQGEYEGKPTTLTKTPCKDERFANCHDILVEVQGDDLLVGCYGYNQVLGAKYPNRPREESHTGGTVTSIKFKSFIKQYAIDLKEPYGQD